MIECYWLCGDTRCPPCMVYRDVYGDQIAIEQPIRADRESRAINSLSLSHIVGVPLTSSLPSLPAAAASLALAFRLTMNAAYVAAQVCSRLGETDCSRKRHSKRSVACVDSVFHGLRLQRAHTKGDVPAIIVPSTRRRGRLGPVHFYVSALYYGYPCVSATYIAHTQSFC